MARRSRVDVPRALVAYAQGLFPMDDPEAAGAPLPFWRADPRAILDLSPEGRAQLRRRVRRSLARDPGWVLRMDAAFERVLAGCAAPRSREDGIWITPRLADLYRGLHRAGFAHSIELWEGDVLAAGVLAVLIRRAAMLESMFHVVPDAGNVALVRTLDRLAEDGFVLCDVQLATDHTRRLGALEIPAAEYDRRLARALSADP